MNKKGIFFMMLTIIILSIFVISITFFSGYALRKSTQQRVESLSDFVNNVESDLSRQLYIVGASAVYLMQNEIASDNFEPLGPGNAQLYLEEIFFNGTIDGNSDPEIQDITKKIKFSDIQEALQEKAGEISASAQMTNPSINITQEDPWNVKVTLVTELYISDNNGLASWNKTLESVSYIAISNFTDPLYSIGTGGQVNPAIVPVSPGAPISSYVSGGGYLNFSGAPSFIDRLEGDFGPSEYGIVSLVNTANIPTGYEHTGRPIVDYIYFSTNLTYTPCTSGGYLITSDVDEVYGVTC